MLIMQAQVLQPQGNLGNLVLPRICVLVDTIPQSGFVFQEKDHIYRAEVDGLVRHFRFAGPGKGMDGAEFQVEMKDGSLRQIKGPWGLSAGYTSLFFDACMDVTLTDDPVLFEQGEGFQASLSVEKALDALRCIPRGIQSNSWHLRVDYDITSGEINILPFSAIGSSHTPQLYISQEALEWMGDFSMKETCEAVTSEIGQTLWEHLRVLRSLGIGGELHVSLRNSAVRLSQLAMALNQTKEISKPEQVQVTDTHDGIRGAAPPTKEKSPFPESTAPLEGEHPHSAEPGVPDSSEEFAVDYDAESGEET